MVKIGFEEGRVKENTTESINDRIRRMTDKSIEHYGKNAERIDDRIKELGREWDIERMIEANAASLALGGLALGIFVNKKWFALPVVVAGFLLQHALQGWCPPVPLFRTAGVRTADEILREKTALLFLKGAFDRLLKHGNKSISEKIESIIKAV